MDVRVFTQAFLGEPDLYSVVRADLVSVNNPSSLSIAGALLPPQSTVCTDFF